MSAAFTGGAVWRAARAAVRRRRLQTVVTGFVVLVSTATLVVALGLLAAASGPFDQAFAKQRGAHLVAAFDAAKATDTQLAATAHLPGVEAAAGPFGLAMLETELPGFGNFPPRTLATVGRADPGGDVDRVDVWAGHWPTGPGQIVLRAVPGQPPFALGSTLHPSREPALTVVGFASSVSWSADAWVAPAQLPALHPAGRQMLYRFAAHTTDTQLRSDTADLTAALPAGALTGSQPYLVLKNAAAGSTTFVPFLVMFGILGLLVAVLIVGNVVSGAVVSGFRHIGVLKALGFTPGQVVAVYLTMISVPAVAGSLLGTVLGNLLARPILSEAFAGFGSADTTVSAWVDVMALLGMPAIAVLAALLPALRARRLSATEAISAGSAPRAGRGLRIQRRLSGTRMPRSVSLGIGMAFARPARSAMTLGAVLLGVLSITASVGFTLTLDNYSRAATRRGS
ncbi:FtsX-like permease family protein [Kitasatospora sp. NPDC002227]|uniref:FtsX-like permease family protein n=1 Tax=Kitasatospora sp. NPDC002227 TaxID=3154773 RepID=UPI0033253837